MTENDFIELVRRMRTLQKMYFKDRRKEDLIKSKQVEAKVDEFLAGQTQFSLDSE